MKKYQLLSLTILLSSASVFATETTTQDVNVLINAQENIHLTQNSVTLTPTYTPTSGVNTSGGPAPVLQHLNVSGGQLITYGTSPVSVTVAFDATSTGQGDQAAWAAGDYLAVTATGGTLAILYGSEALTDNATSAIGEALIPTGADGTQTYGLTYEFKSSNINKGNGTMTGVVTFTASASEGFSMGGGSMVGGGSSGGMMPTGF
jgi:hypothetical protein